MNKFERKKPAAAFYKWQANINAPRAAGGGRDFFILKTAVQKLKNSRRAAILLTLWAVAAFPLLCQFFVEWVRLQSMRRALVYFAGHLGAALLGTAFLAGLHLSVHAAHPSPLGRRGPGGRAVVHRRLRQFLQAHLPRRPGAAQGFGHRPATRQRWQPSCPSRPPFRWGCSSSSFP